MDECGPAVSRLCVATRGGGEPLRSIQESAGFYRLYLTNDPVGGAEFAVAAPGLDEVSLIADLIDAIHQQVMTTLGQGQPVLAGFHVGIIKLTDTGFGGIGVERALALIRDPDVTAQVTLRVAAADSARGGLCLAVAITSRLFEDLRAEGLPGGNWQPIPEADAWLRLF
jgi:hypothetical protein